MISLPRTTAFISLVMGCILAINPAMSLDSDKNAPVAIDADSTSIDFKTGKRILTGNVIVNQGSLNIKADKIVLVYQGESLDTATAYGNPVRFKQMPEGQTEMVHGEGKKLKMQPQKDLITLINKAKITQGNNTITGKTIVYNMKTSKMTVKGQSSTRQAKDSKTPASKTKPGRTRIVIEPGKLKTGK